MVPYATIMIVLKMMIRIDKRNACMRVTNHLHNLLYYEKCNGSWVTREYNDDGVIISRIRNSEGFDTRYYS